MKYIFTIVLFCVVLAACNSTQKNKSISSTDFYKNHQTVALSGLTIPRAFVGRNHVFELYENSFQAILELNNVEVISHDIYQDEFNKQSKLVGGYFDSINGKRNLEKLREVKLNTARALQKSHNVNSIFYYKIIDVIAPFGNHNAGWDGQVEQYWLNINTVENDLRNMFVNTSGNISALSFHLYHYNIEGQQLNFGAGGIELTAKLTSRKLTEQELAAAPKKIKIASKLGKNKHTRKSKNIFVPVALDSLLRDKEKMQFSIERAWAKLLSGESK